MPVEQAFGEPFQGTTQEQGDYGEGNGDSQHDPMTEAANEAEHRTDPYRRGSRQAGDMTGWVAHNHAGTKETDAGQDSLDDAADRVRVGGEVSVRRSQDKDGNGGGTETDERVSAEAGRFSVQFPVQAEERADDQRGAQTQGGVFISA